MNKNINKNNENARKLEILELEITSCKKCPRLVSWREEVARERRKAFLDWDYWGKPVPGFGDPQARVFVVGLAPGAHGSNRTGRMFTGDGSGDFLFPALHRAEFSSQPNSVQMDDGMQLNDLFLTAVCRCVPPQNRPTRGETTNCIEYLIREIEVIQPKVFVALGKIAFDGLKGILPGVKRDCQFSHGEVYRINDRQHLLCSYHPSRQNTQTGRLTEEMFDDIWEKVSLFL